MSRKFQWSQEATRDLIHLYKNHPALYATKDGNYKNRLKRLEALKAIRIEMIKRRGRHLSIDDIKKKIHGLRTQYASQLSKIKKSMQSGINDERLQPSLWCFADLDFLRDTDAVKNAVSSMSASNDVSDSKNVEQFSISEYDETTRDIGSYSDEIEVKHEEVTPLGSPADTSTNVRETETYERTEDDVTAFARLVELELRKINNPQFMRRAKRDILNILMEAQDNCDNSNIS